MEPDLKPKTLDAWNWSLKFEFRPHRPDLETTDHVIAMELNWEERPRPQKLDKKDDPQVWATSLPTC